MNGSRLSSKDLEVESGLFGTISLNAISDRSGNVLSMIQSDLE